MKSQECSDKKDPALNRDQRIAFGFVASILAAIGLGFLILGRRRKERERTITS
ncbi:MAG: hypothetical protein A4E73_02982 [Syntrophaceae bacterium PtaU1.Bin231]|nr:MAG: hypothetical protein A4E73_02982 [Syntrophaceae bacterium PtaU1.Bin231]